MSSEDMPVDVRLSFPSNTSPYSVCLSLTAFFIAEVYRSGVSRPTRGPWLPAGYRFVFGVFLIGSPLLSSLCSFIRQFPRPNDLLAVLRGF